MYQITTYKWGTPIFRCPFSLLNNLQSYLKEINQQKTDILYLLSCHTGVFMVCHYFCLSILTFTSVAVAAQQ